MVEFYPEKHIENLPDIHSEALKLEGVISQIREQITKSENTKKLETIFSKYASTANSLVFGVTLLMTLDGLVQGEVLQAFLAGWVLKTSVMYENKDTMKSLVRDVKTWFKQKQLKAS